MLLEVNLYWGYRIIIQSLLIALEFLSMNNAKDNNFKLQEWVVRFDGQIKHSETFLDKDEYHKNIKENLNMQS